MASKAIAISDLRQLEDYSKHAKKFLCEYGVCLDQTPILFFEKYQGYHGYVNSDCTKVSISPSLNEYGTQMTLMHELVHVHRCQFNGKEEPWLNEGIAKLFEYFYSRKLPQEYIKKFTKNPSITLGSENNNFAPEGHGYPSSFLLVLYLYNRFGQDHLIKKLMTSKLSGWENVIQSISELIQEGIVKIPQNLTSKESILRHFAVAAWLNDPYLAKYALFEVDDNFNGLANIKEINVENARDPKNSLQIWYSQHYAERGSKEAYSLLSAQPFKIKLAEPTDKALVFIYINY